MAKDISKILVTGGNGFVGSHLLFHLTQQNETVTAILRPGSSNKLTEKIFSWYNAKNNLKKINWVNGDVTDKDSLEKAFEHINYIYHCAGFVSFNAGDKDQLFHVNVEGTRNVVNTALDYKIKKLCHVSSVAAIGRDNNEHFVVEDVEWNNNAKVSWYALSKHEAEMEVWRGIAEGLNAVIVNPSIILGPGNWNAGSVKMFQTVYNGLKYFTDGTNGYVDVNDLAEIMILLMNSKISGERFIVNSENISYQKLFTDMAKAMKVAPPYKKVGKIMSEWVWRIMKFQSLISGKKPLITKETARTANSYYFYSNKKITEATGFRFKPIKDTLNYTATFFLSEQGKNE